MASTSEKAQKAADAADYTRIKQIARERQRRVAEQMKAEGFSQRDIGRRLGVSGETVRGILEGRRAK